MPDDDWARLRKLKHDARERADGYYWLGRRYRYSYLRWDRRAQMLVLGAAIASFLAGAALLTNLAKTSRPLAIVLGIVSLIAGLLQVVYSVTNARKRADQYAQDERACTLMRSHYMQFVDTWDDVAGAARRHDQLVEEENKLVLTPTESWTYARIQKDRSAGERPGPGASRRGL